MSDNSSISAIFERQRANRQNLKRSSASDRIKRLDRLREEILKRIERIDEALFLDMRRPRQGAHNQEVLAIVGVIDRAKADLEAWMAPTVVEPSAHLGPHRAYIRYEPRGVVLLLGPWNFPFALIFSPLVPIIAAGNACIVKPNELQPYTAAIVAEILAVSFPEEEVACIQGGIDVAEALQDLPFDHVFFTGSPAVGKKVMTAAAKHLTSVTLELGGKCPAILDESYDIQDAAGKICGARFTNGGQICLAVDHVWVPRSRVNEIVAALSGVIEAMFYKDGELQRDRLPRLVNERNFARVKGYLDEAVARGAVICRGGNSDAADLMIEPTVLKNVPLDSRVMREEIFGPLIPVLPYDDTAEIADQVDKTGKPLGMYIFSDDKTFIEDILARSSSGGVTVRNVVMHSMESNLPFGGVNNSGMGAYNGVYGFRELSHARAVFEQL